MSDKEKFNNLLLDIFNTLDEYYDFTFKVYNERCLVVLIKLIEKLESCLKVVDNQSQKEIKFILEKIVVAMEGKDYVKIRDLLHYDLRDKLKLISQEL